MTMPETRARFVRFRVGAAGYPAAPPTDPDVNNSLIRFLGSTPDTGTDTKQATPRLAHNCAALCLRLDERYEEPATEIDPEVAHIAPNSSLVYRRDD